MLNFRRLGLSAALAAGFVMPALAQPAQPAPTPPPASTDQAPPAAVAPDATTTPMPDTGIKTTTPAPVHKTHKHVHTKKTGTTSTEPAPQKR